jgi:sec-independent protein translocase protein TatA
MFEGLLSPTHLIIILVIALIVLGPKRLPEAGRSLGRGLREFRESVSGPHDSEDAPAVAEPERQLPRETPHS